MLLMKKMVKLMKLNKWISINQGLPPIEVPVLCIIKADCECDHYAQSVFMRINVNLNLKDWEWKFFVDSPSGLPYIGKNKVIYWKYLPYMPPGCKPSYNTGR